MWCHVRGVACAVLCLLWAVCYSAVSVVLCAMCAVGCIVGRGVACVLA